MKVLIDTNILIDYISKREPYFEAANSILMLCANEEIDGCIAAHSVMNSQGKSILSKNAERF